MFGLMSALKKEPLGGPHKEIATARRAKDRRKQKKARKAS
jgi:hypothetical protein